MLRTVVLACLLSIVLAAPVGVSWSLQPVPATPMAAGANVAAWTTDLSPSAFPGDAAAAATSAVGCALGDVTGDGIADLMLLAADPTAGVQRLQALAGPGFQEVVWEKTSSLTQILQCAPDLDLDGTLDPIVKTLGETTGTAAAGATDQATRQVQQVLDGASGVALVGRTATQAVTGAAAPVQGAAAGAAQQASSALLPAAAGAAALLQTETTTALLPIPGGLPLPVDGLTTTITQSAQLQVLDAAGAVVTTVTIDQPGVEVLAMAPLALTGGLPDVAVLTRTLGPVQQVATGVPELAMYAADGTLSWATQLPASTGVPILLPQAGDLNLDGVGDLIVSTVQQGVETAPGAAFTVLSGVDGSLLFDSGDAVAGLMTALPLGQLPDGAALLQVASTEATGPLVLSALGGAGQILWSVNVDQLAVPVNAVLDAHTGDVVGFTDLTGDALPDIAVAVEASGGLDLQAIDGLTGAIAWNATIAGADQVVPVLLGAASSAAGQAGAVAAMAQGAVAEAKAGATAGLLAMGTSSTEAVLTLVDPLTGMVQWVATAAVPTGTNLASLSADAAGDLDGDGTQDLLITANVNGSTSAGADSVSGHRAAADGDAAAPASVTAVSGQSGETLYAASAQPNGSTLDFDSGAAPAAEEEAEAEGSNGIPGPGPLLVASALAVGLLLRRRRA